MHWGMVRECIIITRGRSLATTAVPSPWGKVLMLVLHRGERRRRWHDSCPSVGVRGLLLWVQGQWLLPLLLLLLLLLLWVRVQVQLS